MIKHCPGYPAVELFFAAANIDTQEAFDNWDEADAFVAANSHFSSWHEMYREAVFPIFQERKQAIANESEIQISCGSSKLFDGIFITPRFHF